jgi:alkylhydroperoxidase family enzyme
MARIEPLRMDQVDPAIRHFCEDAERQTGTSASPRTYAKNPAVFKALGDFRAALGKSSTLDPVLRELVRIKIAGLNSCQY